MKRLAGRITLAWFVLAPVMVAACRGLDRAAGDRDPSAWPAAVDSGGRTDDLPSPNDDDDGDGDDESGHVLQEPQALEAPPSS